MNVTFNEDACRVRSGHAPQNLGLLRRIALNALNFSFKHLLKSPWQLFHNLNLWQMVAPCL